MGQDSTPASWRQATAVGYPPSADGLSPTGCRFGHRGIPRGHLTHLQGTATSGATTLAYKLLAQAIAEPIIYIDLPHTFDAA